MSDETTPDHHVREGQRIAKVMARAGLCSRREAEAWIEAGRVTVNGEVLTSPAYNVSDVDDVRVDGAPLAERERTRLFLFHKPKGLVTTARDPEGRRTIFDALPDDLPRVVAIGRLDINTEGLLLLTNDGGLARILELPSTGWLRRYRVRAHGAVDQAMLDGLREGVTVDGVDYAGIDAKLDREQGSNAWITMGLREGKNREIKRVLEHLGLAVNRLIRVSFGPFELGDLGDGEVVEVRTRVLKDQLGAKLAREAGVDFEAPVVDRTPPPPEPEERPSPHGKAPRGRPPRGPERGRGFPGAPRGKSFERDEGARGGPPPPSTPQRRRKHVSALRAEIAADLTEPKTPRKRTERSATQDRKGRTIAVERISAAREADRPARKEMRESGRRSPPSREPPERGRRPDPSAFKAARDGRGRAGLEAAPREERSFEGRQARKGPRERGPERPERREEGDRPRALQPGFSPSAEGGIARLRPPPAPQGCARTF